MAKSGVWGRLDIKNPPTAVGGILEVRLDCRIWFGLQRREGEAFPQIGRRTRRREILANIQTSVPHISAEEP